MVCEDAGVEGAGGGGVDSFEAVEGIGDELGGGFGFAFALGWDRDTD